MSDQNTAVYLMAVHNVTDPELLQRYLDGVFAIGGLEVLALDSAATTLEGDTRGRAVIVRFPNREAAVEFYNSEEYQKVLPLRLNATSHNWLGMVNGLGSEYRDKIEHLYQDAFVKGDMTAVDDVVHPEYVYHGFAPIGPGPEGMKTYIRDDLAGVSDIEVEIEDFFTEGVRAASRLRLAASHTGALFGAPATGKRFEVTAHCTYRFRDGKLVEEWETFEEGKMMTALGLVLEPPS